MINYGFMLSIIIVLIIIVLVSRRFEIIPSLSIWYIIRKKNFQNISQNMNTDEAQVVELSLENELFHVIFFPSKSESSDAGILMIPSLLSSNFSLMMNTASDFSSMGYNVILPLFYTFHNIQNGIGRKIFHPSKYQNIILQSYEYMISSERPEINKRRIGVYSESWGVIFAARLIKNQPIKACVLENCHIEVTNLFSFASNHIIHQILNIFFWPFLWNTDWHKSNSLNNLRGCPTFLINNRQSLTITPKDVWSSFGSLYMRCEHQLYFEHGLFPSSLQHTWRKEYLEQIQSFYDKWLLGTSALPDFHFDFKLHKSFREKGRKGYTIQIRITSIPPSMDKFPLQILLADKNGNSNELRIWFTGAEMVLQKESFMKPNYISVLPYNNVKRLDGPFKGSYKQWMKKDSDQALNATIELLKDYSLDKLGTVLEPYFLVKAILLGERGKYTEARNIIKTSIKSNYWKNRISSDSDAQIILKELIDDISLSSSKDLF